MGNFDGRGDSLNLKSDKDEQGCVIQRPHDQLEQIITLTSSLGANQVYERNELDELLYLCQQVL